MRTVEPLPIVLRLLAPEDVGEAYLRWMNDPEITRFLECRWARHTRESLQHFVRGANESPRDFLFGIFCDEGKRHIGNIKIGNVDGIHRFGDLGLVVGEKDCGGRGVATQAIEQACAYARNELGLHKLVAGIYRGTVGSLRAFRKAGFRRVGVLQDHRWCGGRWVDEDLLERLLGGECSGEIVGTARDAEEGDGPCRR